MSQPIIKRKRVHVDSSGVQGGSSAIQVLSGDDAAPCPGKKAVRLLNDGSCVRAIEVTCSCGEMTIVELSYSEDEA
jgi:hypothetical protein